VRAVSSHPRREGLVDEPMLVLGELATCKQVEEAGWANRRLFHHKSVLCANYKLRRQTGSLRAALANCRSPNVVFPPYNQTRSGLLCEIAAPIKIGLFLMQELSSRPWRGGARQPDSLGSSGKTLWRKAGIQPLSPE